MMTMGAWATVTMPTLTTDTSNPTYYIIQSVRSGKYANYAGASAQLTQVELASADVNALWYFVKNGNGVSIVPAAASDLKLATTSSATAEGSVWYLLENPYNAGTFCVSLASDATANCWDDQGGHTTIGYWQPSGNDYQGTSWNIVEMPVSKAEVDARTVNMSFALTKLDVLARLAPLASLSVYTDNIAAVKNAADESALNAALQLFNANISLLCRSGKYLVVGETGGEYVATPSEYNHAIQLESAGLGTFYLKGYKSEKYMGNVTMSTAIATDETPKTAFYFQTYNGYTVVRPNDTASSYDGYRYIHNGGSGCVGWEPSAANTQHTMAEVTLPAAFVNIKYHLMVNGVDKAQETVEQGVGDAPSVPASFAYDYTTYTYDVTTITAATTDVYATASFNMPFETSTDFQTATWYYLRGHASTNFYPSHYVSTDGTSIIWADGKSSTDAYKWAFIGNPVDGIKVINKGAGDGYYLTDTETATSMTTSATEWVLKQSDATKFGLWSTNRNNYANAAGGTVKYWNQFDNGSMFWVEEIPAVSVDVTFNLVIGGEVVNSVTLYAVAGNTTISVPSSLTANYSILGYEFTGNEDVNVGETNLTVNVTATLKSGVLNNLDNLSNSKAYTLNTERGSLCIKNGHLASNYNDNDGATPGTFALINYEDNYYLYSVDASKFVLGDGTLSETVTSAIATLSMEYQTTLKPLYLMTLGGKGLNVTNTSDDYELVINNWITPDAGNRYCIVENAEFDATDALAALEEYFNPTAEVQFTKVIAQLEAYPYGTGLNQYSMVVEGNDYTSQATTIINGIKSAGYSEENLTNAQLMLDGTSINIPVTNKFYRIKGYSGNYITSNNTGSNASMNGTAGVSNIVYYSAGKNIIFYNGGYGLYNTSIVAPVGSTLNEYTFSEGAQIGHYYIRSNYTDGGQYCYDNTTNETKLDRNGSPVTSGSYQTDWTLEEVTELPITLNSAGDGYYATLYLPVDATITNADAFTIKVNEAKNAANTTQLEGGKVPANTPVLLKGTSSSAIAILNNGDAYADSDLTGTLVAITANGSTDYFLGKNTENQVGFYHWSGTVLKGFRAYLPAGEENGTGAKGFTLVFDEATGINTIDNGKWTIENENVYNLQGQKVNRAQKGVYIVNGKKVVMK